MRRQGGGDPKFVAVTRERFLGLWGWVRANDAAQPRAGGQEGANPQGVVRDFLCNRGRGLPGGGLDR